jgi:hypothetical protein
MSTALVRVPVGGLADGTPYFAPLGEVLVEGSQVICHLCGRALRSVTVHLRRHGWTKQAANVGQVGTQDHEETRLCSSARATRSRPG